MVQGHVTARSWRFKSSYRHHEPVQSTVRGSPEPNTVLVRGTSLRSLRELRVAYGHLTLKETIIVYIVKKGGVRPSLGARGLWAIHKYAQLGIIVLLISRY